MKKWISLMTLVFVIFSSVSYGANFSDLNQYDWAETAIQNMQLNGFVNGYPDGTFKPGGSITRAEFVTIVNKMNGFSEEAPLSFSDLSSKHWAYKEISKAVAAGYIKGYTDGTFKPDANITREQVAMMLNNLYHLENKTLSQPLKDLNKISSWAVQAVVNVVANGIMTPYPDGTFAGVKQAIRAESVVALNNIIIFEVPTIEKWVVSQKLPEQPTTTIPTTGGSGGSSAPTTNEVVSKLEVVVSRMNTRVIPELSTDLQRQTASIIISSINTYIANTSYDTTADVNSAKTLVGQMTNSEYLAFRNAITSNIVLGDLVALNNVFQLIEY